MADWKALYEKWDALSEEMREKLFVSMDKKAREKTEDFKKWLLEDSYREKIYFEKLSSTQRFIQQNQLQERIFKPSTTPLVSEGTVAVLPKAAKIESVFKATQTNIEKSSEKFIDNFSAVATTVKISRGTSEVSPEALRAASLMPETVLEKHGAVVTPEFKPPTVSPEKAPGATITTDQETDETATSKPKATSGNRVVFLLKKPITTISSNHETTANKIVFVLDNKETYLPKSENLMRTPPETLIETKPTSPTIAEKVEITQPQSVMQKQLFRLQLDPQTDISQLLNRLNREKDLLTAINSQECWKCKSTEKTLVNYSVGVDKAEIKLTCKKCGATTTFNHENV